MSASIAVISLARSRPDAWRLRQHCIVPVENVYEPDWHSGKAVPTRIHRQDDKPKGIAGLWAVNQKVTGEEVLNPKPRTCLPCKVEPPSGWPKDPP